MLFTKRSRLAPRVLQGGVSHICSALTAAAYWPAIEGLGFFSRYFWRGATPSACCRCVRWLRSCTVRYIRLALWSCMPSYIVRQWMLFTFTMTSKEMHWNRKATPFAYAFQCMTLRCALEKCSLRQFLEAQSTFMLGYLNYTDLNYRVGGDNVALASIQNRVNWRNMGEAFVLQWTYYSEPDTDDG